MGKLLLSVLWFTHEAFAKGGILELGLARGTEASPAAILFGDILGAFNFSGYNGSAFASGASIVSRASQNFSANGNGTFLEFKTTRDDSTASATRMIIDNNGRVGIGKIPVQNRADQFLPPALAPVILEPSSALAVLPAL